MQGETKLVFGEGFVAVQRTARSFVRVVSVAALVAGLMFLVAPSLHVPSLSGVWAFDLAFIICALALIAWLAAKRLRRGSVLMDFAAPAANLPPRVRSCANRMSLDEVEAVEVCSSLRRRRSTFASSGPALRSLSTPDSGVSAGVWPKRRAS